MKLLTIPKMARTDGFPLTEKQLRRLVADGRIPCVKVGRWAYLDRESVLAAVKPEAVRK